MGECLRLSRSSSYQFITKPDGWLGTKDHPNSPILVNLTRSLAPPLSLVKIAKVTNEEPDWIGYEGREFRIGYYSRQDGLDCVWLVDDDGQYAETVEAALWDGSELFRGKGRIFLTERAKDIFSQSWSDCISLEDRP